MPTPDQPKTQNHGELLLLLTSIIWGSGFIAQRLGMNYFKPFTFITIRFAIGSLVVLAFLLLQRGKTKPVPSSSKTENKTLLLGMLACGLALCAATSLQQIGLVSSTASKAGFITSLYMVLVPIFSVVLGRKIPPKVWVAVALAALGLYLLSIKTGFSIEKGDFSIFLGAFIWAVHILLIDHFSPKVDSLKLAWGQFTVTAILAFLIAWFYEGFSLPTLSSGWLTVLYSGVMVVGIAFTLQVIGQQSVKPSVGVLILSLEAVFALIFGVLLLGERPSLRELFGCLLMAGAVLLVQVKLPSLSQKRG